MAIHAKYIYCVVMIFTIFEWSSGARSRLTNVECTTFDPAFANFSECKLKVIDRGVIGLNIHLRLLKLPVKTFMLNMALLKKANGYKPFLYNITDDFCRFLKNRSRNLYLNVFMDFAMKDSNLNHTCPLTEDIVVHDLVIRENMFRNLPLPTGDYMLSLLFAAVGHDWKLGVKVYISRTED